mmetsp:Transcript_97286/g.247472  ORF Transcript_97286/g.247472 Transcript_97286/m.247472 type:complete len:123 (+) Transcript_97286:435-803(+)
MSDAATSPAAGLPPARAAVWVYLLFRRGLRSPSAAWAPPATWPPHKWRRGAPEDVTGASRLPPEPVGGASPGAKAATKGGDMSEAVEAEAGTLLLREACEAAAVDGCSRLRLCWDQAEPRLQ